MLPPKSVTAVPTLSLFTGAGGLDIGFHQAGYDILGCVEIERDYCATLEANRPNYLSASANIHSMDIAAFEPEAYLDVGIQCVIGGPPCQTFSAAGRRSGGVLGTLDPRGQLFEAYCHILSVLKPKVFVFENVYGLPGANGGQPWREVVQAFSRLGYQLTADVVDAADYGVPQHRERLIIVGSLGGKFRFPMPTHGPDSTSGLPLMTALDAIRELQDPEESPEPLGGLYGHLLPLVPEGLNYSFFTREMGYPEPYFAWRAKFHDFLYKVDRNAPSRTLKAQPGKFTGPFHWNNRHFTTAELRRLQTFPDDYVLQGTETKVIEQIGNSVPPRLAHVLAVSVREQLLDGAETLTYPVRSENFSSTFRQRQRAKHDHYHQVAQQEIARRFPNVHRLESATAVKEYSVAFTTQFSKLVIAEDAHTSVGEASFKVGYTQDGTEARLQITKLATVVRPWAVNITIGGLAKYLGHTETLHATAAVGEAGDIFKVWSIVQDELVANSQFFTLIDIYGHYANRGDTVTIRTSVRGKSDLCTRALVYFGTSEHCGRFLPRERIADDLGISLAKLPEIVQYLRELRYDVRTSDTHPTIRTDEVICTYPFPLLSSRAQLERKLKA